MSWSSHARSGGTSSIGGTKTTGGSTCPASRNSQVSPPGNTHVGIQQITDLHRELGHIVRGLDKPASAGLTLGSIAKMANQSIADLAVASAVDAGALQRHFDGEGPLSKVAYLRVIRAMVGITLVEA